MAATTRSSQHLSLRRRRPIGLCSGAWMTEKKAANCEGWVTPLGEPWATLRPSPWGGPWRRPKMRGVDWTSEARFTHTFDFPDLSSLAAWVSSIDLQLSTGLTAGSFILSSFSDIIHQVDCQSLERQPEESSTALPPSELVFRRRKWNNRLITMQSSSNVPGGVDTWAGSTWWGCLSPTLGRSERLPGERGVFSVRSRAIQARGGTRSRGHHEGRGGHGQRTWSLGSPGICPG